MCNFLIVPLVPVPFCPIGVRRGKSWGVLTLRRKRRIPLDSRGSEEERSIRSLIEALPTKKNKISGGGQNRTLNRTLNRIPFFIPLLIPSVQEIQKYGGFSPPRNYALAPGHPLAGGRSLNFGLGASGDFSPGGLWAVWWGRAVGCVVGCLSSGTPFCTPPIWMISQGCLSGTPGKRVKWAVVRSPPKRRDWIL